VARLDQRAARVSGDGTKEERMNTDVLKGKWTQLKGNVRKQWVSSPTTTSTRSRGDAEILMGRIQERYGRTRDQAEREVDDWLARP
jgi:uncharacterized protein YjbJ (UPF0337 family)